MAGGWKVEIPRRGGVRRWRRRSARQGQHAAHRRPGRRGGRHRPPAVGDRERADPDLERGRPAAVLAVDRERWLDEAGRRRPEAALGPAGQGSTSSARCRRTRPTRPGRPSSSSRTFGGRRCTSSITRCRLPRGEPPVFDYFAAHGGTVVGQWLAAEEGDGRRVGAVVADVTAKRPDVLFFSGSANAAKIVARFYTATRQEFGAAPFVASGEIRTDTTFRDRRGPTSARTSSLTRRR